MTKYYCENCGIFFEEEKTPNINRIHYHCGRQAKIIFYEDKEEGTI